MTKAELEEKVEKLEKEVRDFREIELQRTHFDEVGRDYDFSDMVRALACLTSSAKEASGELIIESDYEYMFGELFDRFG